MSSESSSPVGGGDPEDYLGESDVQRVSGFATALEEARVLGRWVFCLDGRGCRDGGIGAKIYSLSSA